MDDIRDMSKVTMRRPRPSRGKDTSIRQQDNSEPSSVSTSGGNSDPMVKGFHVHEDGLHATNVAIDGPNVISGVDYVHALLGVSIKTIKDIDDFITCLEEGKYPMWADVDGNIKDKVIADLRSLLFELEAAQPQETPIVASECVGVDISIPRKVVEKVSSRLEHTLYGYFIGKRMAYPVVEYYARSNWAKHGLKKIMMNSKGFFFFKFDTLVGLEAVLEGGPWMIRKSPIILKKWSLDTCLRKEELTSVPIWVKLHDVPLQVFEEEGIRLISSFIGKLVMLDSYTTSMCMDSWGRSSFARCLIEVDSHSDLLDTVTIGFPSLTGEGFIKESIRVEYEWRPPRCNLCKIFGHTQDQCSEKVVRPPTQVISPSIVSTSHVTTPTVELDTDGFQKVGKKKKKKGKAKAANGNPSVGTSVKQFKPVPKATTSEPKKGANTMGTAHTSLSQLKSTGNASKEVNVSTSNPYAALVMDDEGKVEMVSDESANLFANMGASSSRTFSAG